MPDGIDRRSVLRGASAAGGLLTLPTVSARNPVPDVDAPGREAPGAVFRAGAASRSIQPPKGVEVTTGGFGTCAGCPTRDIRDGDDLRAGAFVVSDTDGENAVAVVKLDVQGWMAGYDTDDKPGALEGRRRAAAALSDELGLAAEQADVVIQGTHSHAAPANLALWGTNPEYLQFLTEQVEATVRAAAREAEPAVLEVGVGDIGYANNVVLGQPNSYEGWTKDTRLPVVRARAAGTGSDRPGTGRTVGIYAQVPAHENIIFGPRVEELSSGHFGAADRWLESEFGGTAVTGPGTLGDQVTPMQGDATELPDGTPRSYQVVERLGALTGATAAHALRNGRIVQDATVASSDRHVLVPATNAALFAANCTPAGAAAGLEIDRSCEPPFAYGNVIGTWATALRFGDVVIASEPGEAHPHVSTAIRDAFPDATVMTAGQAQDQLGYYYAPWAFPATPIYSVNHYTLNVSLALADENVAGHVANSQALGFGGQPQALDPRAADYSRLSEPGAQVIVFPNRRDVSHDTDGVTVPFTVYTTTSRDQRTEPGTPTVDFGDGTSVEWTSGTYGYHTFPESGEYDVTVSIPNGDDWTVSVTVEDEHHVHATGDYSDLGTSTGDVSAAAVRERGSNLAEAFGVDAAAAAEAVANGEVDVADAVAEAPKAD